MKKKSFAKNFLIGFRSFFALSPTEKTVNASIKKYFSVNRFDEGKEIYGDWKQVGDDLRLAMHRIDKNCVTKKPKHVKRVVHHNE